MFMKCYRMPIQIKHGTKNKERRYMLNKYPDVLTVEELMEILHIGRNKAYELLDKHVIGHKRIGRKFLIPKFCVIDYLSSSAYNVNT